MSDDIQTSKYAAEILQQKNKRVSKLNDIAEDDDFTEEEKNILNLLIWEGPYFEEINGNWKRIDPRKYIGKIMKENILGGEYVYTRSISEIFGKSSSKNTAEVLDLTPWKLFCFIVTIVLPSCLNSYAITYRWLDRPMRNKEEFHNWSNVALAHIEFAGMIILFANMATNMIMLLLDRTISYRWINKHKSPRRQSIPINICILLTYISILPIGSFITTGMYNIFKEEWNFFFNSDEDTIMDDTIMDDIIVNNDTIVNDTIVTGYFDETNLGKLDETFFILLWIYYFFALFMLGMIRLNNFRYVSNDNSLTNDNIVMYDPNTIRQLSFSLKKIGEFSLLKIIAWSRHILPEKFKSWYHKLKGIIKERKEEGKDIIPSCSICTFLCLLSFIPSFVFLVLLLLVLIGVGFLGLVIKVKQVAFVGEVEVLDWNLTNWIQFLAFLNNMLALDLSKGQSLKATLNFLFGGEDAIQDIYEMKAKEKFKNLLVAHSTKVNGFINTIIVFPQISDTDIQKIFLKESKKQKKLNKRVNSSRIQAIFDMKNETKMATSKSIVSRDRRRTASMPPVVISKKDLRNSCPAVAQFSP